jgi:hypothetical protein
MSGKMCKPKPDYVPESLLGGVQRTLEALLAFDLDKGRVYLCALNQLMIICMPLYCYKQPHMQNCTQQTPAALHDRAYSVLLVCTRHDGLSWCVTNTQLIICMPLYCYKQPHMQNCTQQTPAALHDRAYSVLLVCTRHDGLSWCVTNTQALDHQIGECKITVGHCSNFVFIW